MRRRTLLNAAPVFTALLMALGYSPARADGNIQDYTLDRTFDLPASWNGTGDFDDAVIFDDLPDGRLLLVNGPSISVEDSVGAGTFTAIGDYTTTAPFFGPGFVAVSPDGTRAAIGSNAGGSVFIADTTAPTPGTTQNLAASDFAGVWLDNTNLALSNFNGVDVLNTSTGTVTNIISNIGGSSAGITIDAAGNLYTGNGSDFDPLVGSNTGSVKAFEAVAVQTAITSGTAIDFEASGVEVADLLSANTLGFDAFGNFFVGGGDTFGSSGDLGYAGLIDGDAFADRLADPVNVALINQNSSASILRQFDTPQPFIDAQQPPIWVYNDFTGELLLSYFEQSTVQVYVIPEPAAAGLLALGLVLVVTRRHAGR
ncbi:MAG: PEP-CTERM sorting domain-containing protein [Planctomycetota bacterium]